MTDLTDPAAVEGLLSGTTEGEWRRIKPIHWTHPGIASENGKLIEGGAIYSEADARLMAAVPALARALAPALRENARLREALEGDVEAWAIVGEFLQVEVYSRSASLSLSSIVRHRQKVIDAALHPAPDVALKGTD